MSNRNNDVFQVLVTKGNQALLAAGNTVDDLAVGQLGIFDANTHLSVSTAPREFYFAVGVNRSGGSSLEDIRSSAGQFIQRKGISNYSFKPHTAGQSMLVNIANYKAQCDTDYGIRVEFRNSRIYRIQGFNQFSKAYIVRTACCDDCAEGCGSADANELTTLFVNEINSDESGFIVARPIARQDLTIVDHGVSADYSAGDVITLADVAALIAFNAGETDTTLHVFSDFQIEAADLVIAKYCCINPRYHKLLKTVLVTSLIEGFGCSGGVVNVVQEVAFEEGSAENIRQKEYHASGWNGAGPYVVTTVTGLPKEIPYDSVAGEEYDQFILEYEFASKSGWGEYENPLSTIIAVPETDTVTRGALATFMDTATSPGGFEALADDVAAASTNPAVVEPQPADETKDGIA